NLEARHGSAGACPSVGGLGALSGHPSKMTWEIVLQSVVSGLMFGGVIGLVAVGVSLIWGIMDLINFAYGEYLMWSMYLTFFVWAGFGIEPILVVPVSAAALFVAGLVTYRVVIR